MNSVVLTAPCSCSLVEVLSGESRDGEGIIAAVFPLTAIGKEETHGAMDRFASRIKKLKVNLIMETTLHVGMMT